MITQADFAVLPVRKEWTDIGVDYALRSWTQTFNRLGKKNIYSRLSKIIVGVVAEQATRAALESYDIEFDSAGATKWYAIDRYDMGVRGKAIDIKSIFVDRDNRLQMRKLARVGSLSDLQNNLVKFTALVPEDQFNSVSAKNRAGREKIYVFPVVDAHSIVSPSVGRNCHLMWDYGWLKKAEAKDSVKLGKLTVKSQSGGKIRLIGINFLASSSALTISEYRPRPKLSMAPKMSVTCLAPSNSKKDVTNGAGMVCEYSYSSDPNIRSTDGPIS